MTRREKPLPVAPVIAATKEQMMELADELLRRRETPTRTTGRGSPELGAILKKHRTAESVGIRDLARRIGMEESIIAKVENGIRSFSIGALARLQPALGPEFIQEYLEEVLRQDQGHTNWGHVIAFRVQLKDGRMMGITMNTYANKVRECTRQNQKTWGRKEEPLCRTQVRAYLMKPEIAVQWGVEIKPGFAP